MCVCTVCQASGGARRRSVDGPGAGAVSGVSVDAVLPPVAATAPVEHVTTAGTHKPSITASAKKQVGVRERGCEVTVSD